jgi:hypothetical protein
MRVTELQVVPIILYATDSTGSLTTGRLNVVIGRSVESITDQITFV